MGEHQQQEHGHNRDGLPPGRDDSIDKGTAHNSTEPSQAAQDGQPLTRQSVYRRTRRHIARVLQRFGYDVSERALTDWSSAGYLPHPIGRGRGRGGGRVYAYEQRTIVHHAAVVYQLMRWRGRRDYHFLLLWLLGYHTPTAPALAEQIQALLRKPKEVVLTYLLEGFDLKDFDRAGVNVASASDVFAALTATLHLSDHRAEPDVPDELDELDATTDEMTLVDEALEHISDRISERVYAIASALQRRRAQTSAVSPAGIERFVEVMDNTLYNPSFTWLSDDLVRGILGEMDTSVSPVRQAPVEATDTSTSPSSNQMPAQGELQRGVARDRASQSNGGDRTRREDDATTRFAPDIVRMIRFFHAHLSVPHLDAALARATPSQLDRAREDLMQAVHLFRSLWSLGSAEFEHARDAGDLTRFLHSIPRQGAQVASTAGGAVRAGETSEPDPASRAGGSNDEDIAEDAWTTWGAGASLESPAELVESLPYWTRMTWGYNLLFMLSLQALPALLALRQDGYGLWIDALLAAVSEILMAWDETGAPPSGETLRAAWYDVLAVAIQEDAVTAASRSPVLREV